MASGEPQQLFDQAEKKLKKWISFGNKWEEAAELYSMAGNKWKVEKKWSDAGTAFMKASDCFRRQRESTHEAATNVVEAATCYKKGGCIKEAQLCYEQAIEHYIDTGRLSNSAKYEKEIAEMLQNDGQVDAAMQHFRKAADYYSAEDQTSGHTQCLLALADMLVEKEDFIQAAELFETVAKSYGKSRLMTYQVKDCLFKAMLCHLAAVEADRDTNLEKAKEKFEAYADMDLHFPNSREYELVEKVLNAVEVVEQDAVAQAVADYEAVTTLTDQKVSLLLKVRKSLSTEAIQEAIDLS